MGPATYNDLLDAPVISPFGRGLLDLRHGLCSPRRYGSRQVPPRTTIGDGSGHDALSFPCLDSPVCKIRPKMRQVVGE